MTNVLVIGGAGYVGSHTCKALKLAGYTPITYDNLSNGHEWAVKWGPLERGDIRDRARLDEVIAQYKPIGVLHFAALIEVGISVKAPDTFWDVNVAGTLNILNACRDAQIDKFVFSSTCAIFGEVEEPLSEEHPMEPISPYAKTKKAVEDMLADFGSAFGLRSTCLRYFNAAGADKDGETGEAHSPESHLIPLACQTALGQRKEIFLFGEDYPTPDGSCIRDYVHVSDLADAHVLAFKRLENGAESRNFNLGTGVGSSVKEVLDCVREVSGVNYTITKAERRPGDCPRLVGDNKRAKTELGWAPNYNDCKSIAQTAWDWHLAQSKKTDA